MHKKPLAPKNYRATEGHADGTTSYFTLPAITGLPVPVVTPDSASAGVAPYAVGLELADLVGANYLCAFDRSDYKGKIMISK